MNEPENLSRKPLDSSPVDPLTRNWAYESSWLGLWRGETLFVPASLEIISRRLTATMSPFVSVEPEFESNDIRRYRLITDDGAVTLCICRTADKSTVQMQVMPGWEVQTSNGDLSPNADLIHNFVAGSLWWSEKEAEDVKVNLQPAQSSAPITVFQFGGINSFSGRDTHIGGDVVGGDKDTTGD